MASSAAQLALKCERVATTLPRANTAAINSAAINVKGAWLAIGSAHGLTPGKKMRGVGKSGANWNVSYDTKGFGNPTALVRFTGPVHLVIGANKPHFVGAKGAMADRSHGAAGVFNAMAFGGGSSKLKGSRKARASKKKGARALLINGDFRYSVTHPGTSGHPSFWAECRTAAERIAPQSFKAAIPGALMRAGFGI